MLLGVFSVTANAAEVEIGKLKFYANVIYSNATGQQTNKNAVWYPDDDVISQLTLEDTMDYDESKDIVITTETYISRTDGKAMLMAGEVATFTIEDIYQKVSIASSKTAVNFSVPNQVYAFAIFTDGTVKYLQPELINKNDESFDVKILINADKDVKQICYSTYFTIEDGHKICGNANPTRLLSFEYRVGESAEIGHSVRVDLKDPTTIQQEQTNEKLDEANQKLEEMLGTLFNGFNDLGDKTEKGFAGLGEKIKEVFNAITNLPAKIWEFIENGLKNLFVPDEEFMVSYKDKWSNLLAEKLGAVYQVTEIIFGAWDDVRNADQTNTINLPVVTIPLPQNNSFSFGGYDVKIVPDGFESAVELVKVAIGIVCTFMFINGVRRRYDEIMGVNE